MHMEKALALINETATRLPGHHVTTNITFLMVLASKYYLERAEAALKRNDSDAAGKALESIQEADTV